MIGGDAITTMAGVSIPARIGLIVSAFWIIGDKMTGLNTVAEMPGEIMPLMAVLIVIASITVAVMWIYGKRYNDWCKTVERENKDALENALKTQDYESLVIKDTTFGTRYKMNLIVLIALGSIVSFCLLPNVMDAGLGLDANILMWSISALATGAVSTIICGIIALIITSGYEDAKKKIPALEGAIEDLIGKLPQDVQLKVKK